MTTSRTLTLGQNWFTERSKMVMGKQPDHKSHLSGTCDGIAYMALIMFFSGDIDLQTFNEYMEWIHDTPAVEVLNKIECAKNTVEGNDRIKLINIFIFFQNIHLLQKPRDHEELFSLKDKVITQQCKTDILSLITPETLEKRGGIKELTGFCGCYNKNELLDYFSSLKASLKQHRKPFMLILNNVMHVIAVGYYPEKEQWIIVDANRLPAKKLNTVEEITDAVLLSFFDANKAIFSTKVYTDGNHEQAITEDIQHWMQTPTWQAMHAVTPEKAQIIDILGDSWLSNAAKTGCLHTVLELLKQPTINPNQIGKFSAYPLKMAVEEKNEEIIHAISQHHKADINLTDGRDQVTALNLAAHLGYTDIVRFLLTIPGIDINKTDQSGVSALLMAAQIGNVDTVISLLERPEINVNQTSSLGSTALYVAAQNGHLDVLKALLAHPNIDVNLALTSGSSSLYIASYFNHPQIVQALLMVPGIKVNAIFDEYAETALGIATAKGYLTVIEELLEHPDIDVNCIDCYGYTPLLIAVENGFESIVRRLLNDDRVNIHQTNRNGDTPLMIAKAKGYKNIEALLLSKCHEFSYQNSGFTMYGPSKTPTSDSVITQQYKQSFQIK